MALCNHLTFQAVATSTYGVLLFTVFGFMIVTLSVGLGVLFARSRASLCFKKTKAPLPHNSVLYQSVKLTAFKAENESSDV
jgi:hypothetical protein